MKKLFVFFFLYLMLLPPRGPQSHHRPRIRREPPRSVALWSERYVNRGSGKTFELRSLLVENIEAATARWGAVRLMDILRQDLRGNMINLMPESENFSRKGHKFRIHSTHTQYTNTRNFIFILLFTGRCQV